jgi:hypothetical protein
VTSVLDISPVAPPRELTYDSGGHSLCRCAVCGHLEVVDSGIRGTCVLCPGLVELEGSEWSGLGPV